LFLRSLSPITNPFAGPDLREAFKAFDQGMCSFGFAAPWRPYFGLALTRATPFVDGNGTITALELETFMRRVLGDATPSKDQIQVIIKAVDADNSGTIDFDEFLTLMSDPRFNLVDEHRQVFDMFDKDGSGLISVAELREAFTKIGELLPGLSPPVNSSMPIHDSRQAKNLMTSSSPLSWSRLIWTEIGTSIMRNSSRYVYTSDFCSSFTKCLTRRCKMFKLEA
jgi:hypothetical protein